MTLEGKIVVMFEVPRPLYRLGNTTRCYELAIAHSTANFLHNSFVIKTKVSHSSMVIPSSQPSQNRSNSQSVERNAYNLKVLGWQYTEPNHPNRSDLDAVCGALWQSD